MFIKLNAQDKIYKFNNNNLNVFIVGEDECRVFYKPDTMLMTELKRISKHAIAMTIQKNGELRFYKPKYIF